ncbi:MAG: carbon-nitrogen family hydrolase [Desulfitobacteriaceae bacterium]|nr:carbon-nitrogen family hydrolase [Desulfitobacteriaceae bacterium]MDD4752806.1 carbon-nitrogen family hydrolase [Desulfitobacteriaceae bacterium]
MKIKVGLIQLSVQPGNISINEKNAQDLVEKAAQAGSELVVLPELWNCGYDLPNLNKLAQTLHGSSVNLLRSLAQEYKIFIFGGSVGEKKSGDYYNTAVMVDSRGFVAGKYRKIHLFPLGLEEDKYFAPGSEWGLIETPWGTAGIELCYDLRFPELMRNLVLRGARFVVVPAQWPAAREDHWTTLCRARAIENQVYIIACNRSGCDGKLKYAGRSMVISPWGEIITQADDESGLTIAEIDLNEAEKVRKMIPVWEQRCDLLDEIDHSQL